MKHKIVNEVFVERCKMLKDEKGVTFDTIENEVGISKGSMSKYMRGIHLPNSEVVRKLSQYWGVTADYLLGSSDDRNNKYSNGKKLPEGYVSLVQELIKEGISEDEFRNLVNIARQLRGKKD